MPVSSEHDALMICDAQIHAPDVPHAGKVGGLSIDALLAELDANGVSQCIVVPPAAPGPDASRNNAAALRMVAPYLDRLAVMGRFDLTDPTKADTLDEWCCAPGMIGLRVSFVLKKNRQLFDAGELDWFWKAASAADVPVMVLVSNGQLRGLGVVANRYPDLRITIDHFGLTPYVEYTDLKAPLRPLIDLARHENVSVKATALPDSVHEGYPFPSLHEPIRAVMEAFTPSRVFWGSDLTRLRCTYRECIDLFRHELALSQDDKEWVMGRGIRHWLAWNPAPSAPGETDLHAAERVGEIWE